MKKFLVFSHSDLFLQGVARLLRPAGAVTMDSVSAYDPEAVHANFTRVQPDVVIVDSALAETAHAILHCLLGLAPTLRVLTMGISSNQVEVIDKRAVWLGQPDDLAALFGALDNVARE